MRVSREMQMRGVRKPRHASVCVKRVRSIPGVRGIVPHIARDPTSLLLAECVDQLNTDIARLDAVSLRVSAVSRRLPTGSYGAHKVEFTSRSTSDAMSSTGGNRAVAEDAASGSTEVAALATESRRTSDVNLRGGKRTGIKGGGARGASGGGGGAGLESSANRHHIRRLLDML